MSGFDRLACVEAAMERYNARDADGYAAFFTEQGCEASYRGEVIRAGREGIREGMRAVFEQFPENHAEIRARHILGDHVLLHERVRRAPNVEPFEVMSIYSFADEKIERVEFVR